jgi:lysozyme family protein
VPAGWCPDNDRRWRAVFARILVVEGGHVNDAADRGGETQYGISLRFLKAMGGIDANHDGFADLDLNFDTVLDGHDVRALTPEIAEFLYQGHFYIDPGFWNLPRPFDAVLFDQGVNAGVTGAIKLLQRALNRAAQPGRAMPVDGQLGPRTRGALAQCLSTGRPVLDWYRQAAQARYEAIVAIDTTQRRYLKGWSARVRGLGYV